MVEYSPLHLAAGQPQLGFKSTRISPLDGKFWDPKGASQEADSQGP